MTRRIKCIYLRFAVHVPYILLYYIYSFLECLHNDEVNAYYYSIMKYHYVCVCVCVSVCNDARGVPMYSLIGGSFTHFECTHYVHTTLSHHLTKYHYNVTLMAFNSYTHIRELVYYEHIFSTYIYQIPT